MRVFLYFDNFSLAKDDLQILETKYEGPNATVRYVDFSDAVEDVFTKKGLEQNPTEAPEMFDVYSNGYVYLLTMSNHYLSNGISFQNIIRWETDTFINYLDPKDEEILKIVVKRMRSRINERQIDAMSFMEEYDFVKEGLRLYISTFALTPYLRRNNYNQSISCCFD